MTLILTYSKNYKEGFFDFPDAKTNQYVADSAIKFNAITNSINLTEPAIPITSTTSNSIKLALNGFDTNGTTNNYHLELKTDNILPTNVPNAFKQAQSCEAAPPNCSAFDDPTFASNCGMSFDNKGISATGKPHIGGKFVSQNDRLKQTSKAEEVIANNSAPYDPYKVYQPTLGTSRPGTFALTKEQCLVVKEKIDCSVKQTFNSPNCTQCYSSQNFNRVGPETQRIPFTIYLVGNGNVTIVPTNRGSCAGYTDDQKAQIAKGTPEATVCNSIPGQTFQGSTAVIPQCGTCWCCSDIPFSLINGTLNVKTPISMTVSGNTEGIKFNVTVTTTDNSLPYIAGVIEGKTPRGTFKIDLIKILGNDKVSNKRPKINGSLSINGFKSLVIIPSKNNKINIEGLIPFSFLSVYESDALTCDNGPIITQAASATFLDSDPCFGKDNKPGNYKLECLQDRWIELGGTAQGKGYPSNQSAADAIQKDSKGQPLDIDTIVNNLAPKMTSAQTGLDASGKTLALSDWNTVSMWALGIPVNTPCDGPNKDNGPLSQECLSYLYLNQGVNSHIGRTYTLAPSSNASMKGQETANTFCQPGTSIDPSTPDGLKFGQKLGGINSVKQTYDEINRTANDNTLNNQKRATALQQCYGKTLDTASSDGGMKYKQIYGGYLETSGPQPSCFSGLTLEQAQQNCNNLGSQCVAFSFSNDGKGTGCYKGDTKAGMLNTSAYNGYVKIPGYIAPQTNILMGRYIRLQMNDIGCLNLGEIAVFTEQGGNNIINPNTPVTKSSGFQGDQFPSKNLVDGNINTFTHTSCNEIAWIIVDLGTMVPIYKIIITNRQDCCFARANGLVLSILDDKQQTVYKANPITDKSGNSTNGQTTDQNLGYMTFTYFPPNPKVLGDYTKDTI